MNHFDPTITINALSANNTSSVNVILNHLNNLNKLRSNLNFTILTFENSLFLKLIRNSPPLFKYTLKIFPAILYNLSIRIAFEQLILPILTPKCSIILNFGGYFIFLLPNSQITLCQNPYPFYLRNYKFLSFLSLRWVLLFCLFKLSARCAGRSRLLAFNSISMRNQYLSTSDYRAHFYSFILYNPVLVPSTLTTDLSPFPQNSKYFISIAPFSRYKQVHLIFDAFFRFKSVNPHYNLIHIGQCLDHKYYSSIVASIPENCTQSISIYKDHIASEHFAGLISSAYAYISMSKCESFGLPAIEAQLFDVPSIVLIGTAAHEICGDASLIVSDSSSTSLQSVMQYLVSDPSIYQTLSNNAKKNICRFSTPETSSNLLHHCLNLFKNYKD